MQEMQHEITKELKRELFIAANKEELLTKMDKRKAELEREGFTLVRRVKIGRNAPCPCGSGLKFKKCHIDRVSELNPF